MLFLIDAILFHPLIKSHAFKIMMLFSDISIQTNDINYLLIILNNMWHNLGEKKKWYINSATLPSIEARKELLGTVHDQEVSFNFSSLAAWMSLNLDCVVVMYWQTICNLGIENKYKVWRSIYVLI